MKKYMQITISLILLTSLAACAPQINQNPPHKADDLTEPTPYAVYENFSLYFVDREYARIVKEEHELRISENTNREKLILDGLKMGPKSNQLTSPLSPSAGIHSIKIVSGLCTIDVTEDFLNITDETIKSANLMLHAIVQSLCELDTIQQVKFNIDGNTTAKINNEIDLSQPISPNPAGI